MKKLLSLVPAVALLFASSLAGRAGTEMVTPSQPAYNSQAEPGYWVQAPPPPPAYYYPPAPYYAAAPPPYYYGYGPGYYGRGYGYYGPGVRVYAPGIFFGFGFHGRR